MYLFYHSSTRALRKGSDRRSFKTSARMESSFARWHQAFPELAGDVPIFEKGARSLRTWRLIFWLARIKPLRDIPKRPAFTKHSTNYSSLSLILIESLQKTLDFMSDQVPQVKVGYRSSHWKRSTSFNSFQIRITTKLQKRRYRHLLWTANKGSVPPCGRYPIQWYEQMSQHEMLV